MSEYSVCQKQNPEIIHTDVFQTLLCYWTKQCLSSVRVTVENSSVHFSVIWAWTAWQRLYQQPYRTQSCCAGRREVWWRPGKRRRSRSSCSRLGQLIWKEGQTQQFRLQDERLCWLNVQQNFRKIISCHSRWQRDVSCWHHKYPVWLNQNWWVTCDNSESNEKLPWSGSSCSPNAHNLSGKVL